MIKYYGYLYNNGQTFYESLIFLLKENCTRTKSNKENLFFVLQNYSKSYLNDNKNDTIFSFPGF